MNCCNDLGHCTDGYNCPAHAAPAPISRCEYLGVCQGINCPHCPQPEVFECDVPCSPEPVSPTFPFAPGIIEGPDRPPMTRTALLIDVVLVIGSISILSTIAGYVVERLA